MALIIGVCPECNNVLVLGKRTLFCQCDECGTTVAVRDAGNYLTEMCSEPTYVDNVLEMCLELEEEGEIEKALGVITVLAQNNPYNENVGFTYVRMSGYEIGAVRWFLGAFGNKKGHADYATEFLDNVMEMSYVVLVPEMIKFAENKLPPKTKTKYLEVLEGLRAEYTSHKKDDEAGINSLYAIYVGGAAVNAIICFILWLTKLHLAFNILIVMVLFSIEFSIMYLHNKIYGNRLGISKVERILMLVFMCSIPFAIGGAVIVWLLK